MPGSRSTVRSSQRAHQRRLLALPVVVLVGISSSVQLIVRTMSELSLTFSAAAYKRSRTKRADAPSQKYLLHLLLDGRPDFGHPPASLVSMLGQATAPTPGSWP